VFGWPIVEQYIAGAHNMDGHFVETNPRHNLPVLLALTDVWSDSFLGSNGGRIICPFTEAFAAYPAFCATLESQTCGGKGVVIVDGGLHHAYDRALYHQSSSTTSNNNNKNRGGIVLPSELVMTMDSQMSSNVAPLFHGTMEDDVHATQDALICSMFAHADELAFGSSSSSSSSTSHDNNKTAAAAGSSLLSNTTTAAATMAMDSSSSSNGPEVSDGNRPSTLLICGKCDAYTCGQLVALAEHRAVVKARIWDVDPFAKEIGSSLRSKRTERLKEQLQNMFTNNDEDEEEDEEDDLRDGMNLSTKTILRHYANMTRDQRLYVVK
jgi:glucose-6-phosphate isomerase